MQSQQIRGALPALSRRCHRVIHSCYAFWRVFTPADAVCGGKNPRAPPIVAPARRLGTVNDAAICRRILHRSGTAAAYLHDFKTTGRGLLRGGESPLSDVAAPYLEETTGIVMGGMFDNWGGGAMRALH
jgi:hypothetical protein